MNGIHWKTPGSAKFVAALAAVLAGAALVAVETPAAPRIAVDFNVATGPVKPVNGVGQGPLVGWIDTRLFPYLAEAGIPYARLHDVGGAFGGNRFVDIPNVFPDFDADENDPKSYDFRFTDAYLKALIDNGVEPFYRLGVTIENCAATIGTTHRVAPPKDFAKWARICEHVVRHYTQGWANGFKWKITYWEIWNEPEDVGGTRRVMWTGTFRQYCELYEIASKHLKKCFPEIKVGGFAGCGFYSVYGDMDNPAMHERYASFTRNFDEFVAFVKERKCPLDFFSYHAYDTVKNFTHYMDYPRKKLDEAGFRNTEISLNEWLSWSYPIGSAAQGAFIASMMIEMQRGPVDTAMVYDARCGANACAPLFKPLDPDEPDRACRDAGMPRKAYFAMLYFNELRKLGTAVKCDVAGEELHAIAARDAQGNGALYVANNSDKPIRFALELGGWSAGLVRITDDRRTDEYTVTVTELPPHAVAVIRLREGGASPRVMTSDGVGR